MYRYWAWELLGVLRLYGLRLQPRFGLGYSGWTGEVLEDICRVRHGRAVGVVVDPCCGRPAGVGVELMAQGPVNVCRCGPGSEAVRVARHVALGRCFRRLTQTTGGSNQLYRHWERQGGPPQSMSLAMLRKR